MKEEAAPPTAERPIYLDYNATTPVDPRVLAAVAGALREDFGNPSCLYAYGRRAHQAMEAAREEVAHLLGCEAEEVIFTSGGSESDNLALIGAAWARGKGVAGHLITCSGEHPAILETCAFLERQGLRITRLPIDRTGRVDPSEVRAAISSDTFLISVMHANNETGTIQPIQEISRVAREAEVLFHSDAAQSVGKIPVEVDELGVDLLTVAGHKVYAPKGVGALFVRQGVSLAPLIHGGSQEGGRRAGTPAVHQIVGLGAACRAAKEELPRASRRMMTLRDHLHGLLLAEVPSLSLNGHPEERLPNTLNVSFPGVWGADLLAAAATVAASTGSACHSGEARLSPVLEAMGTSAEAGRGAVRLTVGRFTTAEEIIAAAESLSRAWKKLGTVPGFPKK
jgi:cysteine desulfurase